MDVRTLSRTLKTCGHCHELKRHCHELKRLVKESFCDDLGAHVNELLSPTPKTCERVLSWSTCTCEWVLVTNSKNMWKSPFPDLSAHVNELLSPTLKTSGRPFPDDLCRTTLNYRSLLQKSPIKETRFCKRDLVLRTTCAGRPFTDSTLCEVSRVTCE